MATEDPGFEYYLKILREKNRMNSYSCPNCKHNIETEIRKYFWGQLPELQGGSYFDFTCPYCEHPVEIEVIANPDFKVLEPDKRRI